MRLEKLDLVRYGKFTERTLDFGKAEPSRPDFHLVYGPNEAGKSTLFSAFLDLLFGIEPRSAYGFLHPYATMRVGGVVETGGRVHTLARIKRNSNTLLGADDQPLPDTLFSAALGAIDRATYQMMFSLDDDSIERGGEAILKSEGELGTLLFSASSGLPDSSAVFADLRARADAFYKPQGRKHRLSELKAELDVLKDERNAVDTNAREFSALRKALDLAIDRHGSASEARSAIRVSLDQAAARMESLPLLARLRGLRAELAGFPELADAPSAWSQLLPQLMRDETEITTRLDQIADDLSRRGEAIDAIERDERALAAVAALRDLEQSNLEARYRTAAHDLPSRAAERSKIAADIALRLAQLGRADDTDAKALVLPASVSSRLQELAQQSATLGERHEAALRELTAAEQAAREAAQANTGQDNDAVPRLPIDIDALSDRIRLLRQSDCLLRQQAAGRQIAVLDDELADRLTALSPYVGDADALAAVQAPSAPEIAVWEAERAAMAEPLRRLEERISDEKQQIAGEEAQLDQLAQSGGPVADIEAVALRNERDRAWQAHVEALDPETAARFRQALEKDDEATALRLAQSERLAQTRALSLSVADRKARLSVALRERQEQLVLVEGLDERIGVAAGRCGLPRDTRLPQLESWLLRRDEALKVRAALRTARQDLALAVSDEEQALSTLARYLAGAHEAKGGLDEALASAERLVSTHKEAELGRRAAAEGLKRASAAIQTRRASEQAARDDLAAWTALWQETLCKTWLGKTWLGKTWLAEDDSVPTPKEILPVLALLQDVDKLVQRKSDLDYRLDAMEKDQSAFATAVRALSARLAIPDDDDPLLTFETIRNRLQDADRSEMLFARLTKDRASRQAEEEALTEKLARHEAEKQAMLRHFAVDSLTEVDRCLETLDARRRLRERIDEAAGDLCRRMGVENTDAAEAVLETLDESGLHLETVGLKARLAEADSETAELHAQRRDAEKALASIGGSDAAAHLEERRRTVLAEIEARAMDYLRLRAGMLAGETALRLYRERHRSAMMQRASTAFSAISSGEYDGLATHAEKGEEFLIARAAGGASKLARDLSKGTRFQLYLALRMAGYHEIAATRESLPFIADDIMETFDDARAGNAFRLMGDMAEVGQVIYLTHHEHLCEIARQACPSVRVHRL